MTEYRVRSLNDAVAGTEAPTTPLKVAVVMAVANLYRFTGDPEHDMGTFDIGGQHFLWKMECCDLYQGNRVTRLFQVTLAEEITGE